MELVPWICLLCGILAVLVLGMYWVGSSYSTREKLLEIKLSHEVQMQNNEWAKKQECDRLFRDKYLTKKEEEISRLQKEVKALKEKLDNETQVDMERVAFMFFQLSGEAEMLTPEKLNEKRKALQNVYEAIKNNWK